MAPVAPVAVPRPPVGGQDTNAIGRPPRGGIAREPAGFDAPNPAQHVLPPSPRLRGEMPPNEGRSGPRPAGIAPPLAAVPRAEPSRGPEPMRGVEPQRVAPVQPIQPVQRAAEPRAAEPPRAAEAPRPPEAQRPPKGEPRGNRDEQPRGRGERENDRREPTDKR